MLQPDITQKLLLELQQVDEPKASTEEENGIAHNKS
jgi:hypothetical protein